MNLRVLFWILVSPILALGIALVTSLFAPVGPTSSAMRAVCEMLLPIALLSFGALSFWCPFSFEKHSKLARAGMIMIGIAIIFLLMSMPVVCS
jgi:hypothetical protein